MHLLYYCMHHIYTTTIVLMYGLQACYCTNLYTTYMLLLLQYWMDRIHASHIVLMYESRTCYSYCTNVWTIYVLMCGPYTYYCNTTYMLHYLHAIATVLMCRLHACYFYCSVATSVSAVSLTDDSDVVRVRDI